MSTGFYFGMGGVPSVYDEYPDEQPILIGGDPLDLDTLLIVSANRLTNSFK